ncbi:hypothetical protein PAEAM_56610 [Paenibacillus sp. GM1FR]|uniref:hypothetical protein n=1 Tax=Paenibacillus sp. GM1FR TaxID=2059267 RepID=UPI000C2758E4|nr:hypothetical protein [Paenibacillus sp. GM1FR]PJN48799.1 hypothetical protein PAEAM_56610 [Paenibacillus sp. GM1FR]
MKVSDIEGFVDGIIQFVKFTQPEFMDSIAKGQLYMNNIDYFVELENRTKLKGQGDRYDGGNVIREIDFKLLDDDTQEVILEGITPEAIIRDYSFSRIPIYCMTALKGSDFIVVDESTKSYIVKPHFTEEVKELMLSSFGSKAVIIDSFPFQESVENHFRTNNISYDARLVNYTDFNLNGAERLLNYQYRNIESIFTKDLFFEHQKEFRIALDEIETEEPIVINIENFDQSSILCMDTYAFFDEFVIEVLK